MQLSDKVQRVAREENISLDELVYMVKHSAVCRQEGFNRRYYHWSLNVQGNSLVDMRYFERIEVGEGNTSVFEEHGECAGEGCRECGWAGEIIRYVSDKVVPTYGRLHRRDELWAG